MPGGEKLEREDIISFTWLGQRRRVKNGTDMLITLCALLRSEQPDRFEELPEAFRAPRRTWFARTGDDLTRGHRFEHSAVWMETNMSTAKKKEFAGELLRFFHRSDAPVTFETRKRVPPGGRSAD